MINELNAIYSAITRLEVANSFIKDKALTKDFSALFLNEAKDNDVVINKARIAHKRLKAFFEGVK